jgi:hypothetical protein
MVDRFPVMWNDWQWFLHDQWKRTTAMMRSYLETTEAAFALQEKVINEEPRPPEDEAAEEIPTPWDEEQYLRIKALHDDFPVLMRHMTFCAAFAYLEHELMHVCDSLRWFRKLGPDVRTLKGQGAYRAKKYLTTVAKVPIPAASPEWGKICAYGRMRNLIMHNDSLVTAQHKESFDRDVKLTGPVEIDILGRLKLSKEYCFAAIDTIDVFFDNLSKLLPSETGEDRKEGMENLIKALRAAGYREK